MKKIFNLVLLLMINVSIKAQIIPDPMTEPAQAASAVANSASGAMTKEQKPQSALIIKGVVTVNDVKSPLNRVLVNDKYYKLNTIIDGEWKVVSITRKKVILYNIKSKERKNFNFPGV